MSEVNKNINNLSLTELNFLLEQLKKNNDVTFFFNNVETIRKYISRKSRYLKKDLKKKFGYLCVDYLNLFNLIFIEIIKKNFFRKNNLLDNSIINSILSLKKYVNKNSILFKEVDHEISKLKFYLLSLKKKSNLTENNFSQKFVFNYDNLRQESKYSKSVVILSPNPFSLYTGSIVELCNHFSIPIEAIVIRKFSIKRFFEESKRDGIFNLLKKIFNKLIIKGNDNLSYSEVSLKYIFKKLKIKNKNIKSMIKNKNIKIISVNNFKDLDNKIASLKSSIALFTGGGIVSETFINKFKDGVINLHVGNLPLYKGMDAIEATILDGNFSSIALTTHFMGRNVDSGPILSKYFFDSDGYSQVGSIFNEASSLFPFMLIDSYLGYCSGRYKKLDQNNEGKLYFTLQPKLKDLVNIILFFRSKNNNKPTLIKNFANNILKNFIKKNI
jgi:methionyl-tRNA formyltransferase